MIIQRKYATYGQLSQDYETMKEVEALLSRHKCQKEDVDIVLNKLFAPTNDIIFYNTDYMGCLLPSAEFFNDLWEALDRLDNDHPYDNGLTYKDVSGVCFCSGRTGRVITQVFYKHAVEMPTLIVQVITLRYKNGITEIVDTDKHGHIILP